MAKKSSLKAKQARIKKGNVVEVNLKGVEAGKRKQRNIPDGNYLAVVDRVETAVFKSGNKGVTWVFEIVESGKADGAPFWYHNVLVNEDGSTAENNLWAFRGVLQALDPKIKIPDSSLRVPLDKLQGRHVGVEIVMGEDQNGKPRSEINDVFHPEFLEDDEDADESKDDEEEPDDEFEDEEDDDEEDEEEEEDDFEDDEDDEDEDEIDLDEDEL